MPIQLSDAMAFLRSTAHNMPSGPWPWGAPTTEFTRSPAAAHTARLAASQGLGVFHFEHRAMLELPAEWVPSDPELVYPPEWEAGVLPERKYQGFRHDQAIGSFHPHHRAKWSTHELCHGLVGFGWHSQATPFFHATAGRLSELLPVALYYFFDEVFLHRCQIHQDSGAKFGITCADCEAQARVRLDDRYAESRLSEGLAFLDRELAAIARTRRTGRLVPHTWTTLNLCSDGVAYAVAHGPRLQSATFHEYVELFAVDGGGWSSCIDDLEARVVHVASAMLTGAPVPNLCPTPDHGKWRWILQDVGWRLLHVAALLPDERGRAVRRIAQDLAQSLHATVSPSADPSEAERAIHQAATAYSDLPSEALVPHEDDVFGVGYALPSGSGTSRNHLAEGLNSVVPLTLIAAEERVDEFIDEFIASESPRRAPLAKRFTDWIDGAYPGIIAELAGYEFALSDIGATSVALSSAIGDLRLADSMSVVTFRHHIVTVAEHVDSGVLDGVWTPNGTDGFALHLSNADGEQPSPNLLHLLIGRDPEGEVLIVEVPADLAALLSSENAISPESLDDETRSALVEMGVLVAYTWTEA